MQGLSSRLCIAVHGIADLTLHPPKCTPLTLSVLLFGLEQLKEVLSFQLSRWVCVG